MYVRLMTFFVCVINRDRRQQEKEEGKRTGCHAPRFRQLAEVQVTTVVNRTYKIPISSSPLGYYNNSESLTNRLPNLSLATLSPPLQNSGALDNRFGP